MPWVKGKSGNPGGRPKGAREIYALAKKHCPAAIKLAAEVLSGDDESRVRLEAAKILLAYGIGAPPKEPMEDPPEARDCKLSDDELIAELKRRTIEREAAERGTDAGSADNH